MDDCEKAYEKWFCAEPPDNEHPHLAWRAGWSAALNYRNKHSDEYIERHFQGEVPYTDYPTVAPYDPSKTSGD